MTTLNSQYNTKSGSKRGTAQRPCPTNRESAALKSPAQQHRPDREAGADRREQHEVPFFESAGAHRIVQGERNRRRRRVAEAVDVDDYLHRIDAEPFRGRKNDAAIGLVRDEQVEIARSDAITLEDAAGDFLGLPYREFEHRLPIT